MMLRGGKGVKIRCRGMTRLKRERSDSNYIVMSCSNSYDLVNSLKCYD